MNNEKNQEVIYEQQILEGTINDVEMTKEDLQDLLKTWNCIVKKDIMTIDSLMEKIDKGYKRIYGGIVLDPDYQREYKFTTKKESSIIESVLLEIPIPVIYLSQDTEQDIMLLNVIDGMHRLKSIYRFINGEYRLTGLSILKQLEGKKFNQLPKFIQNKLMFNSQIEVNSIDVSGNAELEYEVFLRFNQETNPLTKQELLEVMYRSDYATWFREILLKNLALNDDFNKLFNNTGKRAKDKTLNYGVYACLAYSKYGLIPGKNDSPLYVGKFMKSMQYLTEEQLIQEKQRTKDYLVKLIDFYTEISRIENIERMFSKEFITKEYPQGNHVFLISFLIPLSIIFTYILEKGLIKDYMVDADYKALYNAITKGMNEANFGDFGGVSSTSYKVQNNCYQKMKKEIDALVE